MDIFEVLSRSKAPKAEKVVYLDAEAVQDVERLIKEQADADEIKEAVKRRDASKLTFHLQSVTADVREELMIGIESADKTKNKTKRVSEAYLALLSKTLYKIEDAKGNVDERKFNSEEIRKILNALPGEQYLGLLVAAMNLLGASADYDNAVTVDF
jgi:hypothetical protein